MPTPHQIASDTILLWHLDEPGNENPAADSGPLGLTGTATQRSQGCGAFPGSALAGQTGFGNARSNNGCLEIRSPDHLALGTGEITIEAWVFPTEPLVESVRILRGATNRQIASIWQPTANFLQILYNYDEPGIPRQTISAAAVNAAATNAFGVGPFSLPANIWHHVALTWSDTTKVLALYTDGALRGSVGPAGLETIVIGAAVARRFSHGLTIGGSSLFGSIDDVRVSNTAHSAAQVLKDFLGIPPALKLSPRSGPIEGGTVINALGNFDMSSCEDTFSDGVIGTFWSVLDAGGGKTVELSQARALELDTGQTAGAVAGLRTASDAGDLDIQAIFEPRLADGSGSVVLGRLALVVGTSDFALRLDRRVIEGRRIIVSPKISGQTLASIDIPAGEELGLVTGGRIVLRLIRVGARVIGFVNNVKVVDTIWITDLARVEVSVANDITRPSRVVTRVSEYRRNPVTTFGGEPMTAFLFRSPTRVTGTTPKVRVPGEVAVSVRDCTAVAGTDKFTYTIDPKIVLGDDKNTKKKMIVLSDKVLKQ